MNIYHIHYRLEECRGAGDDGLTGSVVGEFAMSATENKKLMEKIYAGAANRDRSLFIQSLADEVSWCVTGQNKWSHTFKGKEAVLNDLQGYFQSLLVQRSRTVAHRFIADGDFVVVEARGDNLTKTGVRYDNEYCIVFRLTNGKIVEIREYCDSALVERALGEFPASRIRTVV
jgi:ketosteroid isomerase-like protein